MLDIQRLRGMQTEFCRLGIIASLLMALRTVEPSFTDLTGLATLLHRDLKPAQGAAAAIALVTSHGVEMSAASEKTLVGVFGKILSFEDRIYVSISKRITDVLRESLQSRFQFSEERLQQSGLGSVCAPLKVLLEQVRVLTVHHRAVYDPIYERLMKELTFSG